MASSASDYRKLLISAKQAPDGEWYAPDPERRGKYLRLDYAQAGNTASDAEDLIGSIVRPPAAPDVMPAAAGSPAKITVRPGQSSAAQPEDDLIGSIVKSTPAAAPATPVAPMATATPQDEGLPEAVNRFIRENQGESLGERGARLGAGVVRGIGDVGDTLAQAIAATGETGAGALASLGIISPESSKAVRDWRSDVKRRVESGMKGFEKASADSDLATFGRIGGQIAGTGPLLAPAGAGVGALANVSRVAPWLARHPVFSSILAGSGVGGGASALTSAASDEPLAQQIGFGAGTGAVVGPFAHGVSRLMGGGVDAETAALAKAARDKYGIPVGPGQISANPTVRFLDSVLQRLPFTGYAARTAEQQTALNRGLAKEMGVDADKITPDVVRRAKSTAYADYDAAKANLGPLKVDSPFYQDLKDVYDNAHFNLEPGLAGRIEDHLRNVVGKISAGHQLDPDLYQSLTRKNGPLDKAINSKDSKIAGHATDIKEALESLVGRNDPALKALKKEADYKYFVAKAMEPHALESPTGNISPAKVLKAVDFSERDAGELGRIARRFMVEPPSSGTSEREGIRHALTHGLPLVAGALGGGAGAYYFDPENWQRDLVLGGAGLLGARGASAALRSKLLAGAMIKRGSASAPLHSLPLSNLLQLSGAKLPVAPAVGALVGRPPPALMQQ